MAFGGPPRRQGQPQLGKLVRLDPGRGPGRGPGTDFERVWAAVVSPPLPQLAPSEVSQSGNEASVCVDYSVEDSTELEKCDYFEAVEASSPRESPAASPSGPGDALDGILGGRPRPPELRFGCRQRCPWPKVSPGLPGRLRWPPGHPSRGPGGPRGSMVRKAGGTSGHGHFWQHPIHVPSFPCPLFPHFLHPPRHSTWGPPAPGPFPSGYPRAPKFA